MKSKNSFRAGYCALVGRANVGKSTLINALLGEKISIVTPKPQTTRTRVQGILNLPNAQMIVFDTPGICKPNSPLHKAMRQMFGHAMSESDLTVLVCEVGTKPNHFVASEDLEVIRRLKQDGSRAVLVLNKIDRLPQKEYILLAIDAFAKLYDFQAIIPISAKTGDGLDILKDTLVSLLPEGEPLFDQELHTTHIEKDLCAELVREQILMHIHQEVPHSVMVVIESFEDTRDDAGGGMCHLEGRIVVERESQKGILVGAGGKQIKTMSTKARKNIEELLGCKVYLKLTVVVDKDWTHNDRAIQSYGFTTERE